MFGVSNILRSLSFRLFSFLRFVTFFFHNQERLPKLAPASSVFSFADFPILPTCSAALLSSTSLPVLSGTSSLFLGMSARGVVVHVCSGFRGAFSACFLFCCGYMQRAFAFLTTSWSLMVSPSCRCFGGGPTSLRFRWVFLMLWPFVLVVSIHSPWFSDSIGSRFP